VALVSVLFWLVSLPIVTIPAALGGLASFTGMLVEKKNGRIRDFFLGMRRYWLQSTLLGAAVAAVTAVLVVNLMFYFRLMAGERFKIVGAGLSGLTLWMILFWLVAVPYMYPLVVVGGNHAGRAIKLAALIAASNIGRAVALAVNLLAVVTLCLVSQVGTLFLLPALCGILINISYRQTVNKYKSRESGGTDEDEADARYVDRGLRDILRPWDT
jgi:uncharacterized membrane protein YesL